MRFMSSVLFIGCIFFLNCSKDKVDMQIGMGFDSIKRIVKISTDTFFIDEEVTIHVEKADPFHIMSYILRVDKKLNNVWKNVFNEEDDLSPEHRRFSISIPCSSFDGIGDYKISVIMKEEVICSKNFKIVNGKNISD